MKKLEDITDQDLIAIGKIWMPDYEWSVGSRNGLAVTVECPDYRIWVFANKEDFISFEERYQGEANQQAHGGEAEVTCPGFAIVEILNYLNKQGYNTGINNYSQPSDKMKEVEEEAWRLYPNDDNSNKIDRDRFIDGATFALSLQDSPAVKVEDVEEQIADLLNEWLTGKHSDLCASQIAEKVVALSINKGKDTEWVSCEDRLPEVEVSVLAYSERKYRMWVAHRVQDTIWVESENDFGIPCPTHWKPLPTAPNENQAQTLLRL